MCIRDSLTPVAAAQPIIASPPPMPPSFGPVSYTHLDVYKRQPSPTAGSSTSQQANEMADKGMYKPIEYMNANRQGPALVVIPGEIKSNNATFTQKFGPNNIADYAELELGKANFRILERADLGPLLN